MTDGDALLKAVLADPDEDTPRLVYADWLQENGQAERAEFIRVQVKGGSPRLISAQAREWFPVWWRPSTLLTIDRLKGRVSIRDGHSQTFPCTRRLVIRRGFVESLTCCCNEWLAHGEAIVAAHPVRRLTLTDKEPALMGDPPRWGFALVDGYAGDDPHTLPRSPIECGSLIHCTTREAAVDALSDTWLLWARLGITPAPQSCEQCGRLDFLSAFSGWQYDAGESAMLCEECFDSATLEE